MINETENSPEETQKCVLCVNVFEMTFIQIFPINRF